MTSSTTSTTTSPTTSTIGHHYVPHLTEVVAWRVPLRNDAYIAIRAFTRGDTTEFPPRCLLQGKISNNQFFGTLCALENGPALLDVQGAVNLVQDHDNETHKDENYVITLTPPNGQETTWDYFFPQWRDFKCEFKILCN